MQKIYALAAAAAISAMTFGAYAIEFTVSPAPGEVDALPATVEITFPEYASVTKGSMNGKIGTFTIPGGTTGSINSKSFSGNTMTATVANADKQTEPGDYVFTIKPSGMYQFKLVDADGNSTKFTGEFSFTYTIKGAQGGEDNPEDDAVKYDITLKSTTPKLTPYDAEMYDFNGGLQLSFNAYQLGCTEEAIVTLEGPGYFQTAPLAFNYTSNGWTGDITNFKAAIAASPVYNGNYTLTIPQGVIGDEEWMADHTKGHANAAINLAWTVEGAKEVGEDFVDHSLGVVKVTPATGFASNLGTFTFTFNKDVYFAEGTTLHLGASADATGNTYPGSDATVERVDSKTVKVVYNNPAPLSRGEYQMNIPENTFWANADFTGASNAALVYKWNQRNSVTVLSSVPEADAKLAEIPAGFVFSLTLAEGNIEKIGSVSISFVGVDTTDENASDKTLANTTVSEFDGNTVAWTIPAAIALQEGWSYSFEITFNSSEATGSQCLANYSVPVVYDETVGVGSIELENGARVIYNLNGIRVDEDNLPAGLYIVNGRKVVVK